jgi:hypothetical protein
LNQPVPTRNDALEFGRRTRRNFEFIESVKQNKPDAPVHVVTQLTLSLLGIVVFPYEKLDSTIFAKTIAEITAEGWLGWSITLDSPKEGASRTETLGTLLWHQRNAVAHGRLMFNSDSARLSEVAITAEDGPNKRAAVNWRAEIEGCHLRTFCLRFLEFVDGIVG